MSLIGLKYLKQGYEDLGGFKDKQLFNNSIFKLEIVMRMFMRI
jgi:hypothetical protein